MDKTTTLAQDIDQLVFDKADQFRVLSEGISPQRPHGALIGSVDRARDEYVTATGVQVALSRTLLPGRDAPLVEAVGAQELSQVLAVLSALRLALTCTTGPAAAEVVTAARGAVVRRLEAVAVS